MTVTVTALDLSTIIDMARQRIAPNDGALEDIKVTNALNDIAQGKLLVSAKTYDSLAPELRKELEGFFNVWRKANYKLQFESGDKAAFLETIELIQKSRSLSVDKADVQRSKGLVVDGCMGPRTFRALCLELNTDLKEKKLPVLAYQEFVGVTGGVWDISQTNGSAQALKKAADSSTKVREPFNIPELEKDHFTTSASPDKLSVKPTGVLLDLIGPKNPYYQAKHKCGYFANKLIDADLGHGVSSRSNENREKEGLSASKLEQEVKNGEYPVGTMFWVYKKSPEELGLGRDSNAYVRKGKPHYFTLVGYDQNGSPLYTDQWAKKENEYVYRSFAEIKGANSPDVKLGGVRVPPQEAVLALMERKGLKLPVAA